MNSDTLNTVVDSSAVEPVQIGISVHASPLPSTIFKGDTFEYRVNVTWQAPAGQSAVLVVPTGSANAKGITQIGLWEEHSQAVQNGNSVSNTQFVYKLVADDSGNVSIPSLRFQIPSANGPFEFQSESVSFRVEEHSNAPFFAVFGALALVILVGVCIFLQKRKKRSEETKKAKQKEDDALLEEFLLLKKRIAKAESRAWLLDLEKICKSWATKRYGNDNLEELVKSGSLEGWESLIEEFAHARYGGGNRDAFQNKETWKLAAKLLNIEEDE